MGAQYDFKKEWEATKKKLVKISQEAAEIAKKGEQELIRFSQTTGMAVRKERLYYLIGKEYAKAKDPANPSKKLAKLVKELKDIEKEQRQLKKKKKAPAKKK